MELEAIRRIEGDEPRMGRKEDGEKIWKKGGAVLVGLKKSVSDRKVLLGPRTLNARGSIITV